MKDINNKMLLFVLCTYIYYTFIGYSLSQTNIAIILIIFILMSFNTGFYNDYVYFIGLMIFYVISFIYYPILLFLPIFIYDLLFRNKNLITKISFCTIIFSFVLNINNFATPINIFIVIVACTAFLLKNSMYNLQILNKSYTHLIDENREIILKLEKENNLFIQDEIYKLNLAKLEERNSIARDIHDNIGHILSRCIIQIGAIKVLSKNNDTIQTMVNELDQSTRKAMDSVRESVHKLYYESTNIILELEEIINEFSFCEIKFDYKEDIINMDNNTKIAFQFILKESLNNIIKHSNANYVVVTLKRNNSFFQFVIKDNGNKKTDIAEVQNGIGIKNIKKRVNDINGYISITTDDGFKIFINIPL